MLTFCVLLLRPILMVLTKRDWRGTEHLPDGGFVLAANHVSHTDPFLLAHFINDAGIPIKYLAKSSVFDIPVLGRIVRATGQIPVFRDSADAAKAFSAAVEAVEAGECIAIYPEGTLTRDPDLWPMAGKTGAARVALTTGCPVVPVAQWGPQDILYPYEKRIRLFPRRTIHIAAGPPVDLSDLAGRPLSREVLDEASERILAAITDLLAELRGEPAPTTRFRWKGR
jgi:1-acyl-sn-glycerol-3-phosphate acyltransferase